MPTTDPPESLHARATDDLARIRRMMQRALMLMPLPGRTLAAIGGIGLFTAPIAALMPTWGVWTLSWILAAAMATGLAVVTSVLRARDHGALHLDTSLSRFWFSLAPGLGSAALLTLAIWQAGQPQLLAGLWLLSYGVALLAAARHAQPQVRWLGLGSLLMGALALFLPNPSVFMGLGFGVLHTATGLLIARNEHD